MKNHFLFAACLAASIIAMPHGHCLSPVETKQRQSTAAKAATTVKPKAAITIRDKWAVLIGAGRYDDPQVGTVKNANRNVLKIARVLVDPAVGRFPSNHVLVVTDDKANKDTLAQAVCEDWLFKKALPGDLIVLYICMRGCPSENLNDWLLLGAGATYASRKENGISLTNLLKQLRTRTQANNIVCLLDSQIASSVSDKYPQGLNSLLKKVSAASETTILSADENLIRSLDSQTEASSQFVEYFTEGLKAGGGHLSLATIAGFISDSMSKSSNSSVPQKSALLLSPSNSELAQVAIGLPIKNANSSSSNIRFGHSIERLEETNPELAKDARRMAESGSESTPANKINALLKKEDQDEEEELDQNDGPPVDFKPYMDAMKKAIQSKWTTPTGLDKKTIITNFSIQRDGRITEAEIVESSGNPAIDKSALQALKDASPLAPLPKGSPKHVQIHYKFDYKVN